MSWVIKAAVDPNFMEFFLDKVEVVGIVAYNDSMDEAYLYGAVVPGEVEGDPENTAYWPWQYRDNSDSNWAIVKFKVSGLLAQKLKKQGTKTQEFESGWVAWQAAQAETDGLVQVLYHEDKAGDYDEDYDDDDHEEDENEYRR